MYHQTEDMFQFGFPLDGVISKEPNPAYAFSDSGRVTSTDDIVVSISIFRVQTQQSEALIGKSHGTIGLLGPVSSKRNLEREHLYPSPRCIYV